MCVTGCACHGHDIGTGIPDPELQRALRVAGSDADVVLISVPAGGPPALRHRVRRNEDPPGPLPCCVLCLLF